MSDTANPNSLGNRFLNLISGQRTVNSITLLSTLASGLWLIYVGYQKVYTAPVVGFTDNKILKNQTCPSVFIRDWEVYNPGPGDLPGTVLEIDFIDNFDAKTGEFESGVVITDGPGVTHEIIENGSSYRIRFKPTGDNLCCWQSMRCKFHLRGESWTAERAEAILPGNYRYEANALFKQQPPSTQTFLWPVLLLVFSFVVFLLNRLKESQIEGRIANRVQAEIDKRLPNLVAEASIDDQAALQRAKLPQQPYGLPPSGTH